MTLAWSDWLILLLFLGAGGALGRAVRRQSGRSLPAYLVSGRALPWWVAGTWMVATNFSVDTPLVVAGLVAQHGVAGNWLWWNGALSGILTVFLFSRLWRRAGVVTDVEFAELRYGGRPAAILRGFRAFYLAIPVNLIIMGWVTRAMGMVLQIVLDIHAWEAAVLLFVLAAGYCIVAGRWGAIVTDSVQFLVAMIASVVLAAFAVGSVGGLAALRSQSTEHFGSAEVALSILPPAGHEWLPFSTLLAFLAVQWWATWYPGAEPGGGGYIAQRIIASRDERQGLLATLWFNFAHYALRPWPWILVGFVAAVRYPALANPEEGFVRVMVDVLPSPLKGLLLAAFVAAYMSTIRTHLNLGATYLVNDIYLRFLRPGATPAARALAGRIATGALLLLALLVMHWLQTVEEGWKLLIGLGAGTGLVLILRWYWWRINAWSEVSAMLASGITSVLLLANHVDSLNTSHLDYALALGGTVLVTTLVWLTVTFLTAPESDETLLRFYRRVRPGGRGWSVVAKWAGYKHDLIPGGSLAWVNWAAGVVLVYGTVFGVGSWLTGSPRSALLELALSTGAFLLIRRNLAYDETLNPSVDTTPPTV